MSQLESDKVLFERWLVSQKGYSIKAAKDYYSRCKRIEKEIAHDLYVSVSTAEKFEKLIDDIQSFSISNSSNKNSAYTLAATLKSAARKFALFKYPLLAEHYETAHGRSKY